jgi:protein N-lysine methyltransferase METTL21D
LYACLILFIIKFHNNLLFLQKKSVDALIQCLIKLSKESTIIYCCYEERDIGRVPDVQLRFLKLIKVHFQVDKVSYNELDKDYRSQDIIVLKLRLK